MARKKPGMLHDQILRKRMGDMAPDTTDVTGLRQINIATPNGPAPSDAMYPVPSGAFGDRLGTTAAPTRPVPSYSIPSSPIGVDGLTHDSVSRAIPVAAQHLDTHANTWPTGLEAGVPGTGIFSGFISASTTGEFNPNLYGWNAMHVYEQMRRTDADVAAALFAMKLPLFSVTPEIIPGDSSSSGGDGNMAVEVANFVRDVMFGGLERENPAFKNTWVSQSFNEVKENAFLMLDFGCAAHENLWRIDGNHIRPRYLAPRLPHTFYRFWTAEDGETLTALEQLGYRRERYVSTSIPARDLCLFVNRKEGSNFYGISSLRAAYSHYYIKSHLYRIDAIASERNGMGIPWIKFPPGAKKEDINRAQSFVEQMAVSERTGLTTPDGYNFELAGLKGRLRDPAPSIKHHSQEIVRSVMAMFIALGTTETGSRALANTLLDLFRQSLQHYAACFCDCINNFTIRPLVDLNFPRLSGKVPYPKLVFPSIVVIDPVETADVLQKLGQAQVDIIRPSLELEKKVLQIFGLPYGPARTKFSPTMTQVRIMAQPAGDETVKEIAESQQPITQERDVNADPNQPTQTQPNQPKSTPVPVTPHKATPTGQGDEFATSGNGTDIHDLINEIVAGRHGTGVIDKHHPSSTPAPPNPYPRRMTDIAEFQGIPIIIETQRGETREGMNDQGEKWSVTMSRPYGYIRGVLGLDNDELDCFVGPYKKARNAYIIRTKHPQRGTVDEEKVMLGFRGATEARNVFMDNYDSPDHFHSIKSMPMHLFKTWLRRMGGETGKAQLADGNYDGVNGGSHPPQPEVGYDLDGTLAQHVVPFNPDLVGSPIPEAVQKVKRLQAMGYKVWIFTARPDLQPVIRWSLDHQLDLPVTNVKRPQFVAIIDDRNVPSNLPVDQTINEVEGLNHHESQ